MKKLLLSAALLLALYSCKGTNEEDYIRDSFMEYVRTDFGNPKDFLEITKIEIKDSIDLYPILSSFMNSVEEGKEFFSKGVIEDYDAIRPDLETHREELLIITYKIKVRERKGDTKQINEYYAIKKNGRYIISNESFKVKDLPAIIVRFEDFKNKVSKEIY